MNDKNRSTRWDSSEMYKVNGVYCAYDSVMVDNKRKDMIRMPGGASGFPLDLISLGFIVERPVKRRSAV